MIDARASMQANKDNGITTQYTMYTSQIGGQGPCPQWCDKDLSDTANVYGTITVYSRGPNGEIQTDVYLPTVYPDVNWDEPSLFFDE